MSSWGAFPPSMSHLQTHASLSLEALDRRFDAAHQPGKPGHANCKEVKPPPMISCPPESGSLRVT